MSEEAINTKDVGTTDTTENTEVTESSTTNTGTTEATENQGLNLPILEEMAKAGVLFGRKRSVTHPKMRNFIFSTRNGFEIIDLQSTLSQLEIASEFLTEMVSTGLPILFVSIRPEMSDVVKATAEKFGFPYVDQRWPGGALTNYSTIHKRIEYYINLKSDKASGKFAKYTKKEQVSLQKKIARLDKLFKGLESMNKLPAALIIVGAKTHKIAIAEAKIKKIPVIVIANTDTNPKDIKYLIPANDTSRGGVKIILNQLATAIEEGKKKLQKAPPTPDSKKAPQK